MLAKTVRVALLLGVGLFFVVMGFGVKTDYHTSRELDLDKSYKYIIKTAIEDAGLKCIRADEIPHAGTIDVPMFEQLLRADVVVHGAGGGLEQRCFAFDFNRLRDLPHFQPDVQPGLIADAQPNPLAAVRPKPRLIHGQPILSRR